MINIMFKAEFTEMVQSRLVCVISWIRYTFINKRSNSCIQKGEVQISCMPSNTWSSWCGISVGSGLACGTLEMKRGSLLWERRSCQCIVNSWYMTCWHLKWKSCLHEPQKLQEVHEAWILARSYQNCLYCCLIIAPNMDKLACHCGPHSIIATIYIAQGRW